MRVISVAAFHPGKAVPVRQWQQKIVLGGKRSRELRNTRNLITGKPRSNHFIGNLIFRQFLFPKIIELSRDIQAVTEPGEEFAFNPLKLGFAGIADKAKSAGGVLTAHLEGCPIP